MRDKKRRHSVLQLLRVQSNDHCDSDFCYVGGIPLIIMHQFFKDFFEWK